MSPFLNQAVILSLVWLSLLTRLAYLAYVNQPPAGGMLFAPLCGVDAHIYNQFGQNMLNGTWPGAEPLFRTPLYVIYLGLNYAVFGLNHYTPLIVQAMLHSVAVAALYKTGVLIFSRRAGWLAALLYTFYGSTIFFVGCFAPISLVLPLLILILFFALKFQQSQRARYLVMTGLLLGLAGLGRPTVLVLLPAVAIWLWLQTNVRRWLLQTTFLTIAVLLPIAPVTWFNYNVSGNFVLVSSNGPEVLFISNNPDAEGRDILAPGLPQPAHQRMEKVWEAIKRNETTYTREVAQYIKNDPLDWLALEANKLWLLFGKPDLNLLDLAYAYPTTWRQTTVFKLSPVQWYGLLILAALGMLLVRRKHTSLLLLYFFLMTFINIVFFIQLRFRLLLAPVIFLYAAAVLADTPRWFAVSRWRYYLTLICLLAAIPFAPDVWPFALGVMAIGFWQATQLKQSYWPLAAAWSFFVIALLAAQVWSSANRAGQWEDYYLGPEVSGDFMLGQIFQPYCDGLNRVQLKLGIHHDRHDQPVFFYLRSLPDNREIFTDQFNPQHLADRTVMTFTFSPQPDSSRKTYLVYITSPTSHPGNSITIRGFADVPVDGYPSGTAIVGQTGQRQPFPGDLAFAAYCDIGPLQTINLAFQSLPGAAWIYGGLLAGHVLLLVVAAVKVGRNKL